MENPLISEGGKGIRMAGVSRIVTDNPQGKTDEWVPLSDRMTAVKYVSKNGVYRAKDDGLHSWSKVVVNVAGGAAGLTVPTNVNEYGVQVPTGEMGTCTPTAPQGIKPSDVVTPTIQPAIGVVGIDPLTGDMTLVTEEDGEEKRTTVPSAIEIAVPPNKTDYEYGEHVDYEGIAVRLLDASGQPFISDEYPDGMAPLDELILADTIVYGDGGGHSDGRGVFCTVLVMDEYYVSWGYDFKGTRGSFGTESGKQVTRIGIGRYSTASMIYVTEYQNRVYFKGVDGDVSGYNIRVFSETDHSEGRAVGNGWGATLADWNSVFPKSTRDPSGSGSLDKTTSTVYVYWHNPETNYMLETSFTVSVNPPA